MVEVVVLFHLVNMVQFDELTERPEGHFTPTVQICIPVTGAPTADRLLSDQL